MQSSSKLNQHCNAQSLLKFFRPHVLSLSQRMSLHYVKKANFDSMERQWLNQGGYGARVQHNHCLSSTDSPSPPPAAPTEALHTRPDTTTVVVEDISRQSANFP